MAIAMVCASVVGASASHPDFDFEVEGNLVNDGGTDWRDVILDDDYVGPGPDNTLAWDDGPGILLLDDVGNPDATLFKPAGKFFNPNGGDPATGTTDENNPSTGWQVNAGSPGPSQNDLSNTYVYAVTAPGLHENHDGSTNGDLYLVMGMERLKKEGTFDLDFEFNQNGWDGSSGSLVREVGDFVAAYELSGNPTDPVTDLTIKLMVYDPTQSLGLRCDVNGALIVFSGDPSDPLCPTDGSGNDFSGFVVVYFGTAGLLGNLGEATMNGVAIDAGPWGTYDSKGKLITTGSPPQIAPFQFAEARINLSALGIEPACPGFGSVHSKSRSSLESTSDLKDLAGPEPLEVSCALTARKYHDLDADGDQDAGEPFLTGWDIQLWEDSGANAGLQPGEDTLVSTVATDSNGEAVFSGLSDGTYHLVEVCPDDWIQSEPTADSRTSADCGTGTYEDIAVNAQSPNADSPYDFGNYQNISKSGTKFEDDDADGVFDASESGLSGWTINAYADDGAGGGTAGDGILNGTEASAAAGSDTTDANGDYELVLTPGAYVVCEVQQVDWFQSAPSSGPACPGGTTGYAIDLASGESESDNDFGNYQNGTKSGLKWEDRNTDGVNAEPAQAGDPDPEPQLSGWTINIYDDDGTGAPDVGSGVVETTMTEDGSGSLALGEYSVTLPPGDYVACEVLQEGWEQTYPTSGPECPGHTDELPNLGYAFTVTSGQDHVDNDFGNVTRGDINGTKFKDADADGDTADGDAGLAGWTINLYEDDGSGNAGDFVTTTDTDAVGDYVFADLLPGDYVVCEAADFAGNANWAQTFPTAGADCSGGLDGGGADAGNADWGHALTIDGGDVETGDFLNTPLSDIDVSFTDLTGYTEADIICTGSNGELGRDEQIDGGDSDGTASVDINGVDVSNSVVTCTITFQDP